MSDLVFFWNFFYILQFTLQIIDIFPWDSKIVFHMYIGLLRHLWVIWAIPKGPENQAELKEYLLTKLLNS